MAVDKSIDKVCMAKRLTSGWSVDDAINVPKNIRRDNYYKQD